MAEAPKKFKKSHWSVYFDKQLSNIQGVVKSPDTVKALIKTAEELALTKFTVLKSERKGIKKNLSKDNFNFKWHDNIPSVTLRRKVYECRHGKHNSSRASLESDDQPKKKKLKKIDHDYNQDESKNPFMQMNNFTCPAQIIILEVLQYSEYRLEEPCTSYKKECLGRDLKLKIKNGTAGAGEVVFVVTVPKIHSHINHETGMFLVQFTGS